MCISVFMKKENNFYLTNAVNELSCFCTQCTYSGYIHYVSIAYSSVTKAARQTNPRPLSHSWTPPRPPHSPDSQIFTSNMLPVFITQCLHCIFKFPPYSPLLYSLLFHCSPQPNTVFLSLHSHCARSLVTIQITNKVGIV